MHLLRKRAKPIVALLAAAMVNLSVPQQAAWAAMVPTESVIERSADVRSQRERLHEILRREEAHAQLEALGVDPDEAAARVDSLSDDEVALIAGQLDQLPAGAATEPLVVIAIVFLGLLVVLVYTGIFFLIRAITN